MTASLVTTPYKTEITTADLGALVSATFTPGVGEILVVKVAASDASQVYGNLPTNTGFSVNAWTQRVNVGTSGSSCRTVIWTASVTASVSGAITVTPSSGTREHSMVVERWTGAQLAASPATTSAVADATAPFTTTITTAANGSVVSWLLADWSGVDPSLATLSGSPSPDIAATYQSGIYTAYWYTQDAATAGPQTFGVTSVSSGTPSATLAAIEIQSGSVDATATPAAVAKAAAGLVPAVGSLTSPATAGTAADLGGGQGSWSNVTNAQGGDDGTVATWAVP